MTPNVTRIEEPALAALRGGCQGISAINTIRSIIGANLQTLRPEPTVEGYSTIGGFSGQAIKPIALRACTEIASLISQHHPGCSLSGIGGIETGYDAAEFILLGCHSVQVCTGVMKSGYGIIHSLLDELAEFMEQHQFKQISDFQGYSLQFLLGHSELVQVQAEARANRKVQPKNRIKNDAEELMIQADHQWSGDQFLNQTDALSRG